MHVICHFVVSEELCLRYVFLEPIDQALGVFPFIICSKLDCHIKSVYLREFREEVNYEVMVDVHPIVASLVQYFSKLENCLYLY